MPQVSRTLNAVTAPKLMDQAVTWDKSVMMGTRFVGIVAILAAAYYIPLRSFSRAISGHKSTNGAGNIIPKSWSKPMRRLTFLF